MNCHGIHNYYLIHFCEIYEGLIYLNFEIFRRTVWKLQPVIQSSEKGKYAFYMAFQFSLRSVPSVPPFSSPFIENKASLRSRETMLSSKFKVELHKLESTPKPQHAKSCRRRLTEAKMPSEADLDEFFAAAEKDLHKHFAEKYNSLSPSFFTHLCLFFYFCS